MKRWCIALMIAALALVAGCNKSGSNQNSANARVLNAVIDAEPLDFVVADDTKQAAVALTVTTPYSSFSSGTQDVKIRSSVNSTILTEKSLNFPSGTNQTVVIFGRRATLSTLLLTDDTTDPATGKFRVRAVGLSDSAGTVDVYLAGADVTGVPPTISSVGFTTVTDYAEIAEGDYVVTYTAAGNKQVLFQAPSQHFTAGTKNTLTIFPTSGGQLVSAVFLTAGNTATGTYIPNTKSRIKAVNAVPDSTGLSFFAEATALLTNVPFQGASSYITTTTGAHTLRIEASNVPGTTIASLTKTLGSGQDYTLLASNPQASATLTALLDDNSLPTATNVRVRFVNALAGSGNVDALVDFATQASSIAFNSASPYVQIAASSTYTITFSSAGGVTSIATLTPVEFLAGGVYSVYVMGTGTAGIVKIARDR
jgi:Domain of unknown function (DUF4397)